MLVPTPIVGPVLGEVKACSAFFRLPRWLEIANTGVYNRQEPLDHKNTTPLALKPFSMATILLAVSSRE